MAADLQGQHRLPPVKLDDPSFTAPIYANLFEGDDGEGALIWSL